MQPSIPKLFEEYKDLAESVGKWKADVVIMQSDIVKAESRMAQIEKALKSASKEKVVEEVRTDGYRTSWTNLRKAVFVIKSLNKYSTVREVVEAIALLEGIDDADDIRRLIGTMSSTLSINAGKKKVVIRYKDQDGQEWLYGLIEWRDRDADQITPNHG